MSITVEPESGEGACHALWVSDAVTHRRLSDVPISKETAGEWVGPLLQSRDPCQPMTRRAFCRLPSKW